MTADSVVGKRLIVGLTFQDEDERLIGNVQYHVRVLRIDQFDGIVVERLDPEGGVFNVPPLVEALEALAPGEYRLNATGELVQDPDYALLVTVTVPAEVAEDMRSGKRPIAAEFVHSLSQYPPSTSRH
jgi:hypothetical protein